MDTLVSNPLDALYQVMQDRTRRADGTLDLLGFDPPVATAQTLAEEVAEREARAVQERSQKGRRCKPSTHKSAVKELAKDERRKNHTQYLRSNTHHCYGYLRGCRCPGCVVTKRDVLRLRIEQDTIACRKEAEEAKRNEEARRALERARRELKSQVAASTSAPTDGEASSCLCGACTGAGLSSSVK